MFNFPFTLWYRELNLNIKTRKEMKKLFLILVLLTGVSFAQMTTPQTLMTVTNLDSATVQNANFICQGYSYTDLQIVASSGVTVKVYYTLASTAGDSLSTGWVDMTDKLTLDTTGVITNTSKYLTIEAMPQKIRVEFTATSHTNSGVVYYRKYN